MAAKVHELKPTERLAADGQGANVRQRWYVCHGCRTYFRARVVIRSTSS